MATDSVSSDKVTMSLPADARLKALADEIKSALIEQKRWGPSQYSDGLKAEWLDGLLRNFKPPLTPTDLAKVLTELNWFHDPRNDANTARDELFRLARYSGLGKYLVLLGVDPEKIMAKRKMDTADVIMLVGGIVRGALGELGVVARDLIVFGILGAFLVTVMGPWGVLVAAALPLVIDTSEQPFYPSKPPDFDKVLLSHFKNPLQTLDNIFTALNRMWTAKDSFAKQLADYLAVKRSNISNALVAGRYYEAGLLIGEIEAQAFLVGVNAAQLAVIGARIAPRLLRLPAEGAKRVRMLQLWLEVKKDEISGRIGDGTEFYRLRDGRLMVRRPDLGAYELTDAELASQENREALAKAAAAKAEMPPVASGTDPGSRAVGDRGTGSGVNGVDPRSRGTSGAEPTKPSIADVPKESNPSKRALLPASTLPNYSSEGTFMAAMRRRLLAQRAAGRPSLLDFLLESDGSWQKGQFTAKSGRQMNGRYAESAPDKQLVHAGHLEAKSFARAVGKPREFLMIEDADLNKMGGDVIESRGAYSSKGAVLIEEYPVDIPTAKRYESHGLLPPGTVDAAQMIEPPSFWHQ